MSEDINKKKDRKFRDSLKSLGFSLVSIIFAMIVAVFFVMWSNKTGFFESASSLFSSIWQGSFGNEERFSETLVVVTPLLFTGLANALAFRTGLFNIGIEGQFTVGMLAAALVGLIPGIPHILHLILIIIAGILAGGIWAGIPGYLKAKSGTNEVVLTIMLNFIGMYLLNYFVMGPINDPGQVSSKEILKSAQFSKLLGQGRTSTALVIGLILVFVVYFLLWKTTTGYELRAVGLSPFAAEYGGVNIKKNIILAMVISGAIAGIGGATHVAGIQHRGIQLAVFANYGFTGIAVALVAKSNPIGVIFSALLFGALESSSLTLQMNGIPKDIVFLIQSIIIIFVAANYVFTIIGNKRKKRGARVNG